MGMFYEDFEVGHKVETLGRTISIVEIVNYMCLSGIFEEHFMNEEWAEKEGPFGRRAATGTLTLGIAEGLVIQLGLFHKTAIAFLGISDLKIKSPVLEGDTIKCEVEVLSSRPTKKPDRGVVTTKNIVRNQHGDVVMEYTIARLIYGREHKE